MFLFLINKLDTLQSLPQIVNTELFKCIQAAHGASYPAFMQRKLVPVVGNVTEANLGLEPAVAAEIAEEVDVIINSAANTTFDERFKFLYFCTSYFLCYYYV